MNTAEWFLLVGGILLARGLSSSLFKHLPVTPAIIYLLAGLLVGPTVLNVFHFNPLKESGLLEALTEVVVLISLFSAGVKMPAPVTFQHGLPEPLAVELIQLTLIAVTLSIFVHGTSVKPLMSRFWRTRQLPPVP